MAHVDWGINLIKEVKNMAYRTKKRKTGTKTKRKTTTTSAKRRVIGTTAGGKKIYVGK